MLPLIGAAVAAIGLGTQIAGFIGGQNAAKQQAAIAQQQAYVQQQINAQQQSVVQYQQQIADIQYQQTLGQLDASKAVVGKQQEIEGIKLQASTLEATRRKREAIRDMIVARANSLATAVGSGASTRDSSVQGSQAQISRQGYGNVLAQNQNLYAGQNIFDVNRTISDIYLGQQDASKAALVQSNQIEANIRGAQSQVFALNGIQSTLGAKSAQVAGEQSFWQGVGNIGGSLMSNSTSIGNNLQSGYAGIKSLNLFA